MKNIMKNAMNRLWKGLLVTLTVLAVVYVTYVMCCGFTFPYVKIELLRLSTIWLIVIILCNRSGAKEK